MYYVIGIDYQTFSRLGQDRQFWIWMVVADVILVTALIPEMDLAWWDFGYRFVNLERIALALHWCSVFNVMLNQIFFATRVNKLHSVSVRLFANLFRFSILRTYLTQDASKFWVLESSQKVFRLYLKSLLVPCSCSLSPRWSRRATFFLVEHDLWKLYRGWSLSWRRDARWHGVFTINSDLLTPISPFSMSPASSSLGKFLYTVVTVFLESVTGAGLDSR